MDTWTVCFKACLQGLCILHERTVLYVSNPFVCSHAQRKHKHSADLLSVKFSPACMLVVDVMCTCGKRPDILGADFKYRLSQTFLGLKEENAVFLDKTAFAFFFSHNHRICVQLCQLFHTKTKLHCNLTTAIFLSR